MGNRSSDHIKAQRQGKERDNYTCQICGDTEHVQGHHIVDVQFNGAAIVDNIVTLCEYHHRKVHSGRIDIDKF